MSPSTRTALYAGGEPRRTVTVPLGQPHGAQLRLRVAEEVRRLVKDDETDAGGELGARRADALEVEAEEMDGVGIRRAEADRPLGQRHAVVQAEHTRIEASGDHLGRRLVGDEDGDVPEPVEQVLRQLGQGRLGGCLELVGAHQRLRRSRGVETQDGEPFVDGALAVAGGDKGATEQVADVGLARRRPGTLSQDAAQPLRGGRGVPLRKQPSRLTHLVRGPPRVHADHEHDPCHRDVGDHRPDDRSPGSLPHHNRKRTAAAADGATAGRVLCYPWTMLQAVTLDFWNTLFADHRERERERQRAERLHAELVKSGRPATGRIPPPRDLTEAAVADALSAGYDYFDRVWHDERRTPLASEVLEATLAALGVRLPDDAFARTVDSFERLILEVPPEPVPGVVDALMAMAERYKLAVISDTGYSPGDVLRGLLKRHGMLDAFSYLFFSNEHGMSKPDVRVFTHTLAHLGARAGEAAHVGDMQRTDIAGAQAAGMAAIHFVGVDDRDVGQSTADLIVRHFDELPTALGDIHCAGC